jgi:poly-beta-1,6-N-acetyl-D-glucosamine synthase
VNALTASGMDPLPRGEHARKASGSAGDGVEGGLVELRSLPEWRHGEPDLGLSTRTRSDQTADKPRRRSPGRHRRNAPGLDVLPPFLPSRLNSRRSQIADASSADVAATLARGSRATANESILGSPDTIACGSAESQQAGLAAAISLAKPTLTTQQFPAGTALPQQPEPTASPQGRAASTAPTPGRRGRAQISDSESRTTVLIPAHNEAATIQAVIAGVRSQEAGAQSRIIVAADNCSDETADLARSAGAEVIITKGNAHKKPGALNQALDIILPRLQANEEILIQDADTILDPRFIRVARLHLSPTSGAVGAVFYGGPGGGILGLFQRSEFARYARDISRKGDQIAVLSGTAALFLVGTLKAVQSARREGKLPGGTGVYDPDAFTEDNELTLALKTLGYRPVSPPECRVVTEVMSTLPKLWKQRVRWQRGALENLRTYGWTQTTRPYILRQVGMGGSVLALAFFLLVTLLSISLTHQFSISIPWTVIGVIFVIERVVTVRRAGWLAMVIAATLFVELIYDLFQHAVYVKCVIGAVLNAEQYWAAT